MNKVFEDYFNETNGKPFDYEGKLIKLSHSINVNGGENFKIDSFVTKSKWKQGVVFQVLNGELEMNNDVNTRFVLWEGSFSENSNIKVLKGEKLIVYNVWDVGNGIMQYGHNGAGLYVIEIKNKLTFYCNDGFPNDNLDDLVFDVTKLVLV